MEIDKAIDSLYFLCPKCLRSNCSDSAINNSSSCYIIPTYCTDNSQNLHHCIINSSLLRNRCCSHLVVNTPYSNNRSYFPALSSHLSRKNDMIVLWYNRFGHVLFSKRREIRSIPASFSHKQPFLCFNVKRRQTTFSSKDLWFHKDLSIIIH